MSSIRGPRAVVTIIAVVTACFWCGIENLAAAEHAGRVTFGGVPVPGATVTASQADKQLVTSTDEAGVYRLSDLADGVWTIRVEMPGFTTITQDVTIAESAGPASWPLTLRPFDEIARDLPAPGFSGPIEPVAPGEPIAPVERVEVFESHDPSASRPSETRPRAILCSAPPTAS